MRQIAIAVFVLATIVTVQVPAIYFFPETREVPVARLVANLERDLKADPRNIELQINLARLHGMAYALKTEVVAAVPRAGDREEPYYGLHPDLIPYKPERAPTQAGEAAARDHLKKAISHYEAALTLDPKNLLARLGYGWMLDQAGEKTRAIAEYRQVIKQAWATEESKNRMLPDSRFYTAEAAGYLMPLLDPSRDADEISDLRRKKKLLDDKPARAITPLVIPLADDLSVHAIVAPDRRIAFDADGSGLPRQLQHCDEAAKQHHLQIRWELVFVDDGFSGFEFENRPALSRLRFRSCSPVSIRVETSTGYDGGLRGNFGEISRCFFLAP
jgi:tetratricopeptide (TPR) repeat protein